MYKRIAEVRETTNCLDAWSAEHGRDQRIRDLLFDEIGATVPARVNDDLRFAQVRYGIERDPQHAPETADGHASYEQKDEESVPDRKIDNAPDHDAFVVRAYRSLWASNFALQEGEQNRYTTPPYSMWNSVALTGIPQTGSLTSSPAPACGALRPFADLRVIRVSESRRNAPERTTRSPSLIPLAIST